MTPMANYRVVRLGRLSIFRIQVERTWWLTRRLFGKWKTYTETDYDGSYDVTFVSVPEFTTAAAAYVYVDVLRAADRETQLRRRRQWLATPQASDLP